MYSRVVKIIPIISDSEDNEDVQYGIMDIERNRIMCGFITYEEAEEELHYQREEKDKIGSFGGEA